MTFHSELESKFQDSPGPRLSIAVHLFKGDATKTHAWRNHKVQSLHVTSTYVLNVGHPDLQERCTKSVWTDAQIADDTSGKGMEDLVRKQLRSVRCCAMDAIYISPRHLRILVSCGDDGPDQKVLRGNLVERYRHDARVWVSGFSCLLHHQSLGEKRVLLMSDAICGIFSDNLAYYSGMVKLSNLIRSKPVAVMRAASRIFDSSSAAFKILGNRKMKRMNAGRWGYCFCCEADVRDIGQDDMLKLINDVFAPVKGGKPIQRQSLMADVRDDEKACEYTAYRERQSRWYTDARNHVRSPWFWICLDLNYHAKLPWQHFLAFLQQRQTGPDWTEKYGKHSTHTSVLVVSKSSEIVSEFEALLSDDQWMPGVTEWMLKLAGQNVEDLVWSAIISMILCSYCEYISRVHMRLQSWPFKLMWLVQSNASVPCPQRKSCAAELLGEPVGRLDSLSAKVRFIFHNALVTAARNGKLDRALWLALSEWRQHVPSDMQENEGVNSTITYITKLAPTIDLPLLASRVTAKKELTSKQLQHCGTAGVALCDAQDSVLTLALENYKTDNYAELRTNIHRWSEKTDATAVLPLPYHAHIPLPVGNGDSGDNCGHAPVGTGDGGHDYIGAAQSALWSLPPDVTKDDIISVSSYHVDWFRKWFNAGDRVCARCFCFQSIRARTIETGDEAWLCPSTLGFQGHLGGRVVLVVARCVV